MTTVSGSGPSGSGISGSGLGETGRSAVYVGDVVHHRLTPRRHRLRQQAYWLLADLDELAMLDGRLRLFSYNRTNLISLHDRDHGDGSDRPLAEQMREHAAAAGIGADGGLSVLLLCMPRVAGYDFNPLSVYFCVGRDGTLRGVIYEVNNTLGGRHLYVIPAGAARPEETVRQTCEKRFYVSPFLDMDMTYIFRTAVPDDVVRLSVQGRREGGAVINTALVGRRQPLDDRTIARLALTRPLLPIKVVVAIHWHALRMWLGGFNLADQPSTPTPSVTIVHAPR